MGFQSITRTRGVKSAVPPMIQHRLKTAEPTMVPTPTSFLTAKTPIKDVKSSGADDPAAMKVAPATSVIGRRRRSWPKHATCTWHRWRAKGKGGGGSAGLQAAPSLAASLRGRARLRQCTWRQAKRLCDVLKRRHKIVVTHYGEGPEHVEYAPEEHADSQQLGNSQRHTSVRFNSGSAAEKSGLTIKSTRN
eukprot:scaffold5231_cov119-Isochrysis_galbana.AAC.4